MSRIWGLSDESAPAMATPSGRRRRSAARAQGPTLGSQLLRLALIVVVISVGLGFWNLRVQEVSLRGIRLADRETARVTAAPLLEQRWVSADLGPVAERLRELPWVEDLRIRRTLLSNVEIHFTEHEPLFRCLDESGAERVVTATGALLVPPAALDLSALVRLEPARIERDELVAEDRVRLAALVEAMRSQPWPLDRPWDAVDLRGPGGVTLRLAGGTEIWLGGEEFRSRLERMRASHEQWRQRLPGRVDLRFDRQIIVARSPELTGGS